MCDTFALKRGGAVWFAKNSDREPDELQRVEYHAAACETAPAPLQCTYLEIEQVTKRRAVVISRPQWMWGAEMGVNDAGVAIGNEAVFSKSVLKDGRALLGMDLVRLALERASTAEAAADIIIALLEKHGQGGPAACRDKKMRYDNSFMIADSTRIFILETAGRDWALKEAKDGASISNAYSLSADYDGTSLAAGANFREINETFWMPRLACAAARREATSERRRAAPDRMSLRILAAALRSHASGDGFGGGSNRDVCMHSSGIFRPHASTASMIVRLAPGDPPAAAFTGTIHPCISLFKPAPFDGASEALSSPGLYEAGAATAHRAKQDSSWRRAIRRSIDEVEPLVLAAIECGEIERAESLAEAWGREWLSRPV